MINVTCGGGVAQRHLEKRSQRTVMYNDEKIQEAIAKMNVQRRGKVINEVVVVQRSISEETRLVGL